MDRRGIGPRPLRCKRNVLPLSLTARGAVSENQTLDYPLPKDRYITYLKQRILVPCGLNRTTVAGVQNQYNTTILTGHNL